MCGVRPTYHPGKIVVNRTTPFASVAWAPRRYVPSSVGVASASPLL